MICFVQTFIKMLSVSAGSIFLLGLNGIPFCVPLAYQRNNTKKSYDFSL